MTLALVTDDMTTGVLKTTDGERNSRKKLYWKRRREALSAVALERLADLGIEFPVVAGTMTIPEVCDYFGISRSTLTNIARQYYEELIEVGYMPGSVTQPTRYSELALAHVAMILRPSTSDQAMTIQKALGIYRAPRGAVKVHNQSGAHVKVCGRVLDEAYKLISEIREDDPEEVWKTLEKRNRHELQVLTVALAALVPNDRGGLRAWLAEIGLGIRSDAQNKAAVGLASLVPSRQQLDQ